jgi:hypothetical protein
MTVTMADSLHVDLVDVDLARDIQHRLAVAKVVGQDIVVEVSPAAEPEELHRIERAVRVHRQDILDGGLAGLGSGPLAVDRLLGTGPHGDGDCPFATSELIPTPFG